MKVKDLKEQLKDIPDDFELDIAILTQFKPFPVYIHRDECSIDTSYSENRSVLFIDLVNDEG